MKAKSPYAPAARPVTMKRIAREAGVTIATVSLVFKRSPQIPEATRERILKIGERLGYRKSPYIEAHMLCRRKGKLPASSPVLAFVAAETRPAVAAPKELDIAEAYFEGAATRAAARGYRLERFSVADPHSSARRLGEILYTRNIAGVLLAPLPEGWKTLDLQWSRFSVVALGFTLAEPALHRVACDAFHAMTIAIEHCHRLGYRRMGLAMTKHADARVDRRWLAACLMERANLSAMRRLPPLILPDWDEKRLVTWLKKQRPDVLVTPWAGWLRKCLEAHGWSVPNDIGLVTLDSPSLEAPVAGIFQNRPLLGSRAVDILVSAIEKNARGVPKFASTLLIDGLWREGKSLQEEIQPRSAETTPSPSRKVALDPSSGEGPMLRGAGLDGEGEHAETSSSVSMQQVARRLGLHVSTVSLGLRNSPAVAERTRKRVLNAAREMGFHPNPFISTLMKARRAGRLPAKRPPLAFVTAFPTPEGWREKSEVFTQYFEGARELAVEKGFRLDEVWMPPRAGAGEEVSEKLRRRAVQGILLAPLSAVGADLTLRWEWFCTVGFGFTLYTPNIHRVANDHYNSMRRAVRECHRLGYRRIGLALSAKDSGKVQSRWLASYLVQQRELDGLVPVEPLIARRWTKDTVARWLDESRPEVIIAFWPVVLIRWLKSLGYSVPGDVGVVGLRSPELGGPLSGIYERAELLGSRAAALLINLVEQGKRGISEHPNTVLVDGIWNPGNTVRPTGNRKLAETPIP